MTYYRRQVKPLTSLIDGFQKIEPPTTMNALQRYLGTIKFLAKYDYGMQSLLQLLYNLLNKETEFKWTTSKNISRNEKNYNT